MQAVGAYLWELRRRKGVSRATVGKALGDVDHSQIERIEKGQTDTRGSLLLAFVHAVGGNPDDVVALMVEPKATADEGKQLAAQWWSQQIQGATPQEQDERRQQAMALVDALLADPAKLDRLMGYGERLLEEQQGRTETPEES